MIEFMLATIVMSLITAVFCYLAVRVLDLIDFWIKQHNIKKGSRTNGGL